MGYIQCGSQNNFVNVRTFHSINVFMFSALETFSNHLFTLWQSPSLYRSTHITHYYHYLDHFTTKILGTESYWTLNSSPTHPCSIFCCGLKASTLHLNSLLQDLTENDRGRECSGINFRSRIWFRCDRSKQLDLSYKRSSILLALKCKKFWQSINDRVSLRTLKKMMFLNRNP